MDFALTLECYREKCKPVDLVTKKKTKKKPLVFLGCGMTLKFGLS